MDMKAPVRYDRLVGDIAGLLEAARRASARAVNAVMTATYWEIGRRIVEFEQGGQQKAEYGEKLISRLAADLATKFGRGFSKRNVEQMRAFYLGWEIAQTPSAQLEARARCQTLSGESSGTVVDALSIRRRLRNAPAHFPLPWSAYVRLLAVKSDYGRRFYETEALRCGWSVRQLDRQIESQFYERTALSRNKAAMLTKGAAAKLSDAITPEEGVKDPFVLEFLGLKDEYSETQLEEALVRHLETFLLELGGDFCFVGRQRRLRIGDEWYRVDLVFFHRRLRCLVVIDLKLGKFSSADIGQMHVYLNYARAHWTQPGENPPVGLVLCAHGNDALARYALDNLPNKVLAAEYRTALPEERVIAGEIERTRRKLERRKVTREKQGR
jgi:predicted nuclease of restriction endonuclease-like (RecB) superfamily